jgi:hypothetical protein
MPDTVFALDAQGGGGGGGGGGNGRVPTRRSVREVLGLRAGPDHTALGNGDPTPRHAPDKANERSLFFRGLGAKAILQTTPDHARQ